MKIQGLALLLPLSCCATHNVIDIRGGLVPQADSEGGDYYEKFELDYGSEDKSRIAGSLRGFIASGKIAGLTENDPFFKWWNQYLETGPEPIKGRLKPFYVRFLVTAKKAADFGDKEDLERGQNPKIIIVKRNLKWKKDGELLPGRDDIDVEVRDIWQPWLRARCNFAVRYIVPSRVNLIQMMQAEGRFTSELSVDNTNGKRAWATMTFKPTFAERLRGKRDVVVKRYLDGNTVIDALASPQKVKPIVIPSQAPMKAGSSTTSLDNDSNVFAAQRHVLERKFEAVAEEAKAKVEGLTQRIDTWRSKLDEAKSTVLSKFKRE